MEIQDHLNWILETSAVVDKGIDNNVAWRII
jgi:hypothetical protein